MRKPFPAGEACLYCEEQLAEGDSGAAVPLLGAGGCEIRHFHKECQLRAVLGSDAHRDRRCTCYGGTEASPGRTPRQEALDLWGRVTAASQIR